MYKLYLTLIMLTGYLGQAQTLSFDYDQAGNQILRELICISCDSPSARPGNTIVEKSDFIQSDAYQEVSYFPNPVQQELHVKWSLTEDLHVISLEVYSMTGQLVSTKKDLDKSDSTVIAFQGVSQGIYNVILNYNNGEKKILKVIKK